MVLTDPAIIRMEDLRSLKERAELFQLPPSTKRSETGFGSTVSPFKSRGLDFQEVRVYQPGDDIRQIDWHVTAKYGKPFTKLYTEEKERTIFFVTDLRSSMKFASHGEFKNVIAAKLTAFMAFVAENQKDRIGYLVLTDEGIISSGMTETHGVLTPLLKALTTTSPVAPLKEQGMQGVSHLLGALLPVGSIVFFFSDFVDWDEKIAAKLGRIGVKNTFLLCPIYDELEVHLPDGALAYSDGRETVVLSGQTKSFQEKFYKQWMERTEALKNASNRYGWGLLPLKTKSDYLNIFARFCFQGGILNGNAD